MSAPEPGTTHYIHPSDGIGDSQPSIVLSTMQTTPDGPPKRDWRFWMIFVCITISMFLSALELVRSLFFFSKTNISRSSQSAVSTALPSIVHTLQGDQFVWIGSAYTLCSTAFVPLSGGFAQVRFFNWFVWAFTLICSRSLDAGSSCSAQSSFSPSVARCVELPHP